MAEVRCRAGRNRDDHSRGVKLPPALRAPTRLLDQRLERRDPLLELVIRPVIERVGRDGRGHGGGFIR